MEVYDPTLDYGRDPTPREVLDQLVADHFTNGDPEFYNITADELEMYNVKNRDYAGGGDDPNGNFNRVSKFFAMYPDLKLSDPRVIALTYMMKQLDQVLWSLHRGYEGVIEGLDPRLADIHIYAKIARVINRSMKPTPEKSDTREDHAPTACCAANWRVGSCNCR